MSRQAPQHQNILFKTEFLNSFNTQANTQAALSFKAFCDANNVSHKTAYGWAIKLNININSHSLVVHISDKRCLIDGYLQQSKIDKLHFSDYLSNIKSKYAYHTARSWLLEQAVVGPATAVITQMVHPGCTAMELNILFRQWGVLGIDLVEVVNQPRIGRGLQALQQLNRASTICGFSTYITDAKNPQDDIYQIHDCYRTKKFASVQDLNGVIQFGILANQSFCKSKNNSQVKFCQMNGALVAVLVATRLIKKGEYINMDYGEEYWRHMVANYVLSESLIKQARDYLGICYEDAIADNVSKKKQKI